MSEGQGLVVVCPHAAECPGCPLIGLPYEAQLGVKRDRVTGATGRYPEVAHAEVGPTIPASPVVGYRARAKLVVEGKRVGLFERGSHRVVDIPDCRVMDPELAKVASAVRGALPLVVPLRALDLQRVEGGVLATLVVPEGTPDSDVRDAAARVRERAPSVTGIAVGYRDEASHQVLGRAPSTLSGVSRAEHHVLPGGPFHLVSHGGFTQAHRGQQRVMFDAIFGAVERVRGSIAGAEVLELYAGAGALAFALATRGAHVIGAEAFDPAVRLAREAAEAQALDVAMESGDAGDVTRTFAAAGRKFDVVIVNPPRRGLAQSVRADLARLSPAVVVYISCEPATLARDLADFARRGLVVQSLAPYDMMPLTEEVETLAVLVPGPAPLPVVLFEDAHLLAVVKSPHEPTTPQGEHVGSLLERVKRIPGAEHAVPVHRLDGGTSGVCLFAKRPAYVADLARALTNGEKEYLALARGIVRDKGSIRRPLMEQGRPHPSRTRYSRLEVVGGHSLVSVRPDEGRKHQIRRHLASIAHPIVGDERYGEGRTNHHFLMKHFLDRPFLHCAKIRLARESGELELTAPLAPDLEAVLQSLRGIPDASAD